MENRNKKYLIITTCIIVSLSCKQSSMDADERESININNEIEGVSESIDSNIENIKELQAIDLDKYGLKEIEIDSIENLNRYKFNNTDSQQISNEEIEVLKNSIDRSNN